MMMVLSITTKRFANGKLKIVTSKGKICSQCELTTAGCNATMSQWSGHDAPSEKNLKENQDKKKENFTFKFNICMYTNVYQNHVSKFVS